MTKEPQPLDPLTLEDCGGGHRIITNVNPYRAVAALTAAILEEAGNDLEVFGNDLHCREFLKQGQFIGEGNLQKIEWGKHPLARGMVIRAKWPATASLEHSDTRTAGLHLKQVKVEVEPGIKRKVDYLILTKATPYLEGHLCGRMDLERVQQLVVKANAHLRVCG